MAEDPFSLHIDSDWKKQAQEEKRRLAEDEQKRVAAAAASAASPNVIQPDPRGPSGIATSGGAPSPTGSARGPRGRRELPPPTFASLVQSMVTQILFYLGELSPGGAEGQPNLDMAKHQLDSLTMLEEKTTNNLTAEEKDALDHGLYETRMRFVNVASQFL